METARGKGSRLLGRPAAILLAVCLAMAALAPCAGAAGFGASSFGGSFDATEAGATATQAGSHPYSIGATILFNLETKTRQSDQVEELPIGQVKDIDVELPAGLIGDPTATPRCPAGLPAVNVSCPEDTQVGVASIYFGPGEAETFPIWNVVPPADAPGLFSFNVLGAASPAVVASVRPDRAGGTEGYGLNLQIDDIPQVLPIYGAGLTFFGVPSQGTGKPFLTLPTSCSGEPLTLRAELTSWEGDTASTSFAAEDGSGNPLRLSGCDRIPFRPRVSTALDGDDTDSPSGLSVEIQTPQSSDPNGIATAHLRSTTVVLPPGVSVNPSAAGGLVGCSTAQLDQFGAGPATCPDDSRIGDFDVESPLVPNPIEGGVYLAKQGENPFHSMLALYLVGEGDGIRLKLPGKVVADPDTGRLTVAFDETPQLPFEDLTLHLYDGPRAALATPVTCGAGSVESSLAPWSGNPASSLTSSVVVSGGPGGTPCPSSPSARSFSPGLEAGTVSPAAALHSPFDLTVTRPDGSQELGSIEATLPRGLLATLKGVPECAAAAAAAGTCAAASQVGSVVAGAGAGSNPYYVKGGRAYLTGPYGGAPLGLDFVVPVVAGPLDLGEVNVRAALFVDPETAQVTVRSDPLPKILDGIPLRLRSLAIDVDRPGFMINPTSCDPTAVTSTITSTESATAKPSDRFQAAGCGSLAFAPKVTPRLLGARRALRRGGHPRLRVAVVQKAGGANLSKVSLTLPRSILLDQGHIRTICTRVQFAAQACPAASVYGTAKVYSPLLDQPLMGPVYLRSSDHTLPDLVFDLRGQIRIVLAGRIDSHKGGIRVSFGSVPDAALSRFVLDMKGGAKGLLQDSADLCAAKKRAIVHAEGQNGASAGSRPLLAASCRGRSGNHRRKAGR